MSVLDFFGVELPAVLVALAIMVGLLGVRRDGAVRAQLHQGPAVDGRHLLRPQAHLDRREGESLDGRLPRGPRRRGAASAASSRWPTSLNIVSIPLRIQRAYTKEGVAVTVEAVANVKIASDDMSLRGAPSGSSACPPSRSRA